MSEKKVASDNRTLENENVTPVQESAQPKKQGGRRIRSLEFFFEPFFDVHLNMSIDYDTSVRINDPKLGVVLPEMYIPVAEKSNQICELNKWALEEACDILHRTEERDASINSLTLDTSVRYLAKPYFVQQAIRTVEKSNVAPDKFCFRLRESILESEKETVKKNIIALRDYGFIVAIDDFGVEYTALSHLGQYEVDYLGIHRSLVEGIDPSLYEDDDRPRAVVQGIIDFAKRVGLKIKVDGIDTEEKAALLRKMGADQLKGTLYCKAPITEKQIK